MATALAEPEVAKVEVRCSSCGKVLQVKPTKAGKERVPKGWKRHEGIWCGVCWKKKFVLRAVTMAVRSPVGEGVTWKDFREALKEGWREHTRASNWLVSELYTADCQRGPKDLKLPKMEKTYFYPQMRDQFPKMAATATASLENAVKAKYMRKRYKVIWTNDESLSNMKYPQPIICPAASWAASYETAGKDGGDDVPCVSVRFGDKRWLLQLRGGKEFGRQLGDLRQLVEGTAIQCELAILRKRVGGGGSDNRNGIKARDSGGQHVMTRVMVKLVGWFPRKERSASGTLVVKSDPQSFLVAYDSKASKIRTWNSDHIKRWMAEHTSKLNRWSDDQKAEQRRPRRKNASFQSRRDAAVVKHRSRIDTFCKETAAQIAGVAERMNFADVKLDVSDRSYFGEGRFEWRHFKDALTSKLNAETIGLEIVGDVDDNETEVSETETVSETAKE